MQERETVWKEVSRMASRQRMLGDCFKKPWGLSRMYTLGLSRKRLANGFRVLKMDQLEVAEFEVLNIQRVECEPVAHWRHKAYVDNKKFLDRNRRAEVHTGSSQDPDGQSRRLPEKT